MSSVSMADVQMVLSAFLRVLGHIIPPALVVEQQIKEFDV